MLFRSLGNETDSESNDSEVTPIPYKSRHHHWHCHLQGNHADFPSTVNSLLDSGAHAVLIELHVADDLALHQRLLPKPLPIKVALNDHENTQQPLPYMNTFASDLFLKMATGLLVP